MRSSPIPVTDDLGVGGGAPLLIIAGPDVIEGEEHTLRMARALSRIATDLGVPLVFKASFDKANRTSARSFRGPGLREGLPVLRKVRETTGLPITTDFHTPDQAAEVAEVADILQVPAFLSRQTDMLLAAGKTGRTVNIKKGQFLAPADAGHAVEKVRSTGNDRVMITERGSSFGYHNLVVDFRTLSRIRAQGIPVCFDASHSVQLPGGKEGASGGERDLIAPLARAAVAVGVDAVFFEVHDDPAHAPCDADSQVPLDRFPALLESLLSIDRVVRPRTG